MHKQRQDFTMISSGHILLSALLLALAASGCASKGSTAAMPSQAAPPATAKPEATPLPPPPAIVEQPALDRLKQMSETLAAAQSFTYKAHSSAELPAKTGQFLTFFAESEVALQRPNKLHAKVAGDAPPFEFYYDGSSISTLDPGQMLYATSPAPATIDEMLPFAMDKTGINFPAADFLYSNPYQVMTEGLTHAIVVGPDMVNGVPCEHFAYMSPGVNWEIWIESGKHALPQRLAVTYKAVQNFPRFMVEFSEWNLKPKIAPALFALKKPANAKQIEFGGEIKQLEK
jgi:hypothetical protein